MKIAGLTLDFERMAAPLPLWHARVCRDDWQQAAIAARQGGGEAG